MAATVEQAGTVVFRAVDGRLEVLVICAKAATALQLEQVLRDADAR